MSKLKFDYIYLDKIDISLSNVRKSKLEEGIDELAKSINEIELQQPIMVTPKGDRFELIIGQRRYLACKKLGMKRIPAVITTVKNETEAILISFSENVHRLDLEYRDKMKAAIALRNKLKSISEVAKRLGVSDQTVRNYLGYSAVPEAIRKMVDEGKLYPTTALRIAKNIPDEKQAVRIAKMVEEKPRSEDKIALIDVAAENPGKSDQEIDRIAKDRSQRNKITIHVTKRIYEAIILASKEYQSDKEDLVKEVVEEWLKKKGFIE